MTRLFNAFLQTIAAHTSPPRWSQVLPALLAPLCCAGALAGPLTIAVSRTPLSLPLYVAQEKGFFAAEGLAVEMVDCVGGHRCMKMLLDGRVDVATVADLPVALHSFERQDFVLVGTIVTNPDDVKLIVRDGSNIAGAQNLVGKRIGMVAGTSSQFFLGVYLLTAGVDPQRVTQVALQPEEMVAALRHGKVDAIAIWEPYAFQATQDLAPAALPLPGMGVYTETFNLIAQRKLAGDQDAVLVQLLRAVDQAEQFIRNDPQGAKALLRRRLQLNHAFVETVWPAMSYRLSLDQSLLSTLETQARRARHDNLVTSRAMPNFLRVIHAAPLRQVKPTAVTVPD